MPVEWDIPFTVVTPTGTLLLNEATTSPYTSDSSYLFLLDHQSCNATTGPLRIAIDSIPQADGSIIHPAFKNGYQMNLTIQFWIDGGGGPASKYPACDTDRRVMWDTLLLYMNALVNPSVADLFGGNCRVRWQPSGYFDERMLNRLRLVAWPTATDKDEIETVTLTFGTEFPYEMDATEKDEPDVPGTSTPYTNDGNTETFPVFRVTGPAVYFEIHNLTSGQQLIYDDSLPGALAIPADHWIEIDTFRNTAYGYSAVAATPDWSQGVNLKPGIDVLNSDFWSLQPGTNNIELVGGGTCQMLWNNAWCG